MATLEGPVDGAGRRVGYRLGHDAEAVGRRRPARPPGWPGASRGCRRSTRSASADASASSICRGSRPSSMPTTSDHRAAERRTPRSSVSAAARGAVGVVGPVDDARAGSRATTSKRPGDGDARRRPPATTSSSSAPPEERLDRGDRDGGVVGLVGAVEREEDLVDASPLGRAQVDQRPAADRELVGSTARSRRRAPSVAPGPRPGRRPAGRGRARPAPGTSPGLTMPAFSEAIACAPVAGLRRCGRGRCW